LESLLEFAARSVDFIFKLIFRSLAALQLGTLGIEIKPSELKLLLLVLPLLQVAIKGLEKRLKKHLIHFRLRLLLKAACFLKGFTSLDERVTFFLKIFIIIMAAIRVMDVAVMLEECSYHSQILQTKTIRRQPSEIQEWSWSESCWRQPE
jgi:hypothetical protein